MKRGSGVDSEVWEGVTDVSRRGCVASYVLHQCFVRWLMSDELDLGSPVLSKNKITAP